MSRGPAGPSITVTLRKVSTGHKICAFAMEDLNHAFSFAKILVRSPEYNRCYAVATSWQGETLFNVQPECGAPAPYQAPVPQQFAASNPYPPPQAYQQPYALPAYPHPQPQYPPTGPHEYRAVPVYEAYAPPPPFPALPGKR